MTTTGDFEMAIDNRTAAAIATRALQIVCNRGLTLVLLLQERFGSHLLRRCAYVASSPLCPPSHHGHPNSHNRWIRSRGPGHTVYCS
jgi:hypothetical protein